jgi:hypothetical protein
MVERFPLPPDDDTQQARVSGACPAVLLLIEHMQLYAIVWTWVLSTYGLLSNTCNQYAGLVSSDSTATQADCRCRSCFGSASRVVDVGCGAGVLIPHLQVRIECRRLQLLEVFALDVSSSDTLLCHQAVQLELQNSVLNCNYLWLPMFHAQIYMLNGFSWIANPRKTLMATQAHGVQDILAVDLSQPMLEVLAQRHCLVSSTVGNDPMVSTMQCSQLLPVDSCLRAYDDHIRYSTAVAC